MSALRRWVRWFGMGATVTVLFGVAAILGGWSPDVRKLSSVRILSPADYRADATLAVAPLSPKVFVDAAGDGSASSGTAPTPRASASSSAAPSSSRGPSPTPTPVPTPTLPIPTPTLPIPTPTLPIPTPTPPIPTPTLPIPPLP